MWQSFVAREVSNGFCAVLASLWIGAAIEAHAQAELRNKNDAEVVDSFRQSAQKNAADEAAFHQREVNCLTNIIIREAGGEPVGFRRFAALVYIARRDDKDPQWPKSLCAVSYQPVQVSGITKPRAHAQGEWERNHAIASEMYWGIWKTQFMPQGWECVRFYKMSDEAIAKLTVRQREQLKITDKALAYFKTLRPIATWGVHTFYEDPKRCVTKLPTIPV